MCFVEGQVQGDVEFVAHVLVLVLLFGFGRASVAASCPVGIEKHQRC